MGRAQVGALAGAVLMLVCVAAMSTWHPAEEATELGAKVRVMPVSLSTSTLLGHRSYSEAEGSQGTW